MFPAMEHSIEEIVQKRTAVLQQKYDELVRAGVRHAEENARMVGNHRSEIERLLNHIKLVEGNFDRVQQIADNNGKVITNLLEVIRSRVASVFVIVARTYDDFAVCPEAFVTRELADAHITVWRGKLPEWRRSMTFDVHEVRL